MKKVVGQEVGAHELGQSFDEKEWLSKVVGILQRLEKFREDG